MNLELVEKMTELLETRRTRYREISEEYNTATGERANELFAEASELVEGNNRIKKAINKVKKANNKLNAATSEEAENSAREELENAQDELYVLANYLSFIWCWPENQSQLNSVLERESAHCAHIV